MRSHPPRDTRRWLGQLFAELPVVLGTWLALTDKHTVFTQPGCHHLRNPGRNPRTPYSFLGLRSHIYGSWTTRQAWKLICYSRILTAHYGHGGFGSAVVRMLFSDCTHLRQARTCGSRCASRAFSPELTRRRGERGGRGGGRHSHGCLVASLPLCLVASLPLCLVAFRSPRAAVAPGR